MEIEVNRIELIPNNRGSRHWIFWLNNEHDLKFFYDKKENMYEIYHYHKEVREWKVLMFTRLQSTSAHIRCPNCFLSEKSERLVRSLIKTCALL